MVADRLGQERLVIAAEVLGHPKRPQQTRGVPGEHPVEVVRAVGQVVAEQHGGQLFGFGHDEDESLGGRGSRGARGAPIIGPMPTMPTRIVAASLALGLGCLLLAGCAQERSAGEIRESANNAYAAGDYAKALAEWEEYARVHPVPLASDLGRGKALLALERPGEAITPLERVYRDDPQDEEKLKLLIEALYGAGEHDRLIALLRDRTRQPGTVE